MSILSEKVVTTFTTSTLVVEPLPQPPDDALSVSFAMYSTETDSGVAGNHLLPLTKTIPQGAAIFSIGVQLLQELTPNNVTVNIGLNSASDVLQNYTVPPVALHALALTAGSNLEYLYFEILNTNLESGKILFKIVFV